ncbi:bacteriohemerythrin [Seleniivibrio woodruffii]|uniref:bacteriohemerythrin n=1 Tax=Seleniivibrio woodruffii TaxID=1078050 RepID=UPI0039E56A08
MASFGEEFCCGIAFMDNGTKRFISELNKLSHAMKTGEGRQHVVFALDYLAEYTEKHLKDEEKVMIKYRFHDIENHAVQHDELRTELSKVIGEYAKRGADHAFPLLIQRLMADWLSRHISKSDKILGDYFIAMVNKSKTS